MGNWLTQDGRIVPIQHMASSHLLNTIHMIERNRFQQMVESAMNGSSPEIISVYAEWNFAYEEMVLEARKRNLIWNDRKKEKKSHDLIKTKKTT